MRVTDAGGLQMYSGTGITARRGGGRRMLLFAVLLAVTLLIAAGAPSLPAAQAAGPSFVYQTTYSGAQFDSGHDEVVDASGNAYILARAYDTSNDVMVVKLSPSGAVLFVTYLRGSLNDWGTGLALDGQGGLLVSGWTDSSDFPVVNAAQPVKDASRSAFLSRLSTATGAVVYSSFFGASGVDEFHDVVVNAAGEIFLVGKTDSTDFPTLNALQAHLNVTSCFCDDAFVVRLPPMPARSSTAPTWAARRTTRATASAWMRPATSTSPGSPNRPISPRPAPFQPLGAATTISGLRASRRWRTSGLQHVPGGSKTEYLGRLAVDPAGYATLAGTTNSSNFPTTLSAYQPVFGGGLVGTPGFGQRSSYDAFVTRLAPDGRSLVYSTFLGGASDDEAHGVVTDAAATPTWSATPPPRTRRPRPSTSPSPAWTPAGRTCSTT